MTSFLAHYGVIAVFVLMAIDAVLPAFSELVMVYGGALASGALASQLDVFGSHQTGTSAYLAIALAGTLGYLAGSIGGWAIGWYGGHPFIERYGRRLHLGPDRVARAERWFTRFGSWAVLIGRVTPVARSFISIPAGLFRAPLGSYTVLTAIGSAAWAFALAGAGWGLGSQWERFDHAFKYVEVAVVVGIVVWVTYLVVRKHRSITMS